MRARSIRVYTNVPTETPGRFTRMKKSAEHSRRRRSIGKGKRGKGWRSHPRRSVPADCIGSATTATADHARPGTVSEPAADHRRTATTTGTEGQRTDRGPVSRRLSSGCTMAAWAVVAFTTKKGGNCCHNKQLWQQLPPFLVANATTAHAALVQHDERRREMEPLPVLWPSVPVVVAVLRWSAAGPLTVPGLAWSAVAVVADPMQSAGTDRRG